MQVRRRHPLNAPAAALLLAALTAILAASASGRSAGAAARSSGQKKQLDRACVETVANIQQAVKDARGAPVDAIHSHVQVVTPGRLTGKIAFNAAGKHISLAGPSAAGMSFGCGEASARSAGAGGGSRVVSTLRRTFTKPGLYALTFTLNRAGEQMLAQLHAADNAYFKRHPNGQNPPTLAFGVALSYSTAG